jgi:hypothetical protein
VPACSPALIMQWHFHGDMFVRLRRNDQGNACVTDWAVAVICYHPGPMTNVRSLIEDFTNQLTAVLDSQAMERARHAVESAFGVRRPGRPAKAAPIAIGKKARKKAPRQLCPVPGCKNPAAPVYGMVCAKHKDVAKAKIRKYREARKAKKLGIKPPKAAKRRAKKLARPKPVAAAKTAAATAA